MRAYARRSAGARRRGSAPTPPRRRRTGAPTGARRDRRRRRRGARSRPRRCSGLRPSTAEPHSPQKTFSKPPGGAHARRCSSPAVTLNEPARAGRRRLPGARAVLTAGAVAVGGRDERGRDLEADGTAAAAAGEREGGLGHGAIVCAGFVSRSARGGNEVLAGAIDTGRPPWTSAEPHFAWSSDRSSSVTARRSSSAGSAATGATAPAPSSSSSASSRASATPPPPARPRPSAARCSRSAR